MKNSHGTTQSGFDMPIVMRLSFQSETNGSFSYTIEYTYIKDRAGSEYTKKEQCDGGKFQIGNHD